MGCHGLGCMGKNGERFSDFCAFNYQVIGGSIFPYKAIHKAMWISPDGQTLNQVDHITIARKWRTSLLDVKIASDHHLGETQGPSTPSTCSVINFSLGSGKLRKFHQNGSMGIW